MTINPFVERTERFMDAITKATPATRPQALNEPAKLADLEGENTMIERLQLALTDYTQDTHETKLVNVISQLGSDPTQDMRIDLRLDPVIGDAIGLSIGHADSEGNPGDPEHSFVLTPAEARNLAARLLNAADLLESSID